MYIVKAEANQVEKIVDISIRAFETDVNVGSAKYAGWCLAFVEDAC